MPVRRLLLQLLSRPVSVGMASCAVIVGGAFALTQLPLGLAPSRDIPMLSVDAHWGGTSAESVEKNLTSPIEEIVSSLRGVRKVRSVSQEGRCHVSAEFDPSAAMNLIRLELNEKISLLVRELPHGVSRPIVEQYIPENLRRMQGFLSYSLVGALPRADLLRIVREEIVPRLMSIKGVARVTLEGEEPEEVCVELSPAKMDARDITVGDVASAMEAAARERCWGSVRGPAGIEGIRFSTEGLSLRELEDTPIQSREGCVPIRLSDLATITIRPSAVHKLLRRDGRACVDFRLARDPLCSLPGTAHDVQACLAEVATRFPPSVELVCGLDESQRMSEELHLLYRNAMISLFLVWGALVLFLGNNRLPLLLLSSILLSLAATFLILWIVRVPLHVLTLAGLTLGAGRLLDDSIVVLENLRRWIKPDASHDSIVEGAWEVLRPSTASTMATVGALMPVLFLPRGLQVYLLEFAFAVTISLSMSLLVSFTVIPSVVARMVKNGVVFPLCSGERITLFYRWVIRRALRRKVAVLLLAVWMFGFPVWLLPVRIENSSLLATLYNETVGGSWYATIRPAMNALFGGASYQFFRNVPQAEFFEQEHDTFLVMQVSFPLGSDLVMVDTIAQVFERTLLKAGARGITTELFDANLLLRIDFRDSLAATSLPHRIRSCMLRLAAQTGGVTVSVAGFGSGYTAGMDLQPAFTVRVLGYDYTRVEEIAQSLRERLLRNPRVGSADIDKSFGNWSARQEVALRVDRNATARYGLTMAEVAAAVQSRTDVLPERMVVKMDGMQLPCIVTVQGSEGFSVQGLSSAGVSNAKAAPVPLRTLLVPQQRAATSEIVREDQQYVRCVSFEYKGPYRHAEAFLAATLREFRLPAGYRFDRTGETTVSDSDRHALLLGALAAFVIVFMVTASLYESLVDALIVMLSVPLAYTGVFMAYVLTGTPFGRGGYVSVMFLAGIAVANAIMIVDFITQKEKTGSRRTGTIVEASVCRFRPVMMTTLTTAGTLLPMLFNKGGGTWYMLALGMFGGLLTSAVLTLVVIPAAYAIVRGAEGDSSLPAKLKLTLPPFFQILKRLGK
jgi:HAE1 family hydrophobic/amphiphilic exporter-1